MKHFHYDRIGHSRLTVSYNHHYTTMSLMFSSGGNSHWTLRNTGSPHLFNSPAFKSAGFPSASTFPISANSKRITCLAYTQYCQTLQCSTTGRTLRLRKSGSTCPQNCQPKIANELVLKGWRTSKLECVRRQHMTAWMSCAATSLPAPMSTNGVAKMSPVNIEARAPVPFSTPST